MRTTRNNAERREKCPDRREKERKDNADRGNIGDSNEEGKIKNGTNQRINRYRKEKFYGKVFFYFFITKFSTKYVAGFPA